MFLRLILFKVFACFLFIIIVIEKIFAVLFLIIQMLGYNVTSMNLLIIDAILDIYYTVLIRIQIHVDIIRNNYSCLCIRGNYSITTKTVLA